MNQLIGESSTLANTLEHVSRVAPINRPILVIGERGSGKELIAERLHFLSSRWQESFHKVNCAAISDSLLDSELFGHEAGAFTGATRSHPGRFERANGGTLFLDELGTMPLRIQEKLLRLIEYGEFERLGGRETLQVDVRIVAATNADLPAQAKEGKFRYDLLDRLSFDVVHVPPLRERMEDLEALVNHFGSKMSVELERDIYPGFSEAALDELRKHSWDGNIRELRNVVERSLCHWEQHNKAIEEVLINPFHTEEQVKNDTQNDKKNNLYAINTVEENEKKTKSWDLQEAVKELEIKLLRDALTSCNHHQQHTANKLGLSYHQLRSLLRKYKTIL